MEQIVEVYFFGIKKMLLKEVMEVFFDVCKVLGLKKKLFMLELIDWLKLLLVDDIFEDILCNCDIKSVILLFYGVLVKNEQDVYLLECLVFMYCCES